MRPSSAPTTFLPLLTVLLSSSRPIAAAPFEFPELGFAWLHGRDGSGNCGSELQFTCSSEETCSTTYNAGSAIAFCTAGAASPGGDSWGVFTTTFTETDLVIYTSTYTSSWQAPATTQAQGTGSAQPAICTASLGQQSCGVICCASDQACAGDGWCTAASTMYTYTGPAPTQATTSSYLPPYRQTGPGSTVSATTTQPFVPPATASGSTLPIVNHGSGGGSGLSGGAIAGIVIGVLVAVALLILICFCCIVRAGFHGILSLLGLRNNDKKKKTERVETVERYSRHNSRVSASAASRRDTHSGWFGSRPSRVEETRKKSGGWGGLTAVTAGLVGLAVILGLRRRSKRKEEEKQRRRPVSDVSSSYYSYSYTGTSASK